MSSFPMRAAAAAGCIVTATLLQGCIGLAIKGVQVVNDKVINPAQPVLRGSADFLDDTLTAEASLRPSAKRHHLGVGTLLGEEDSGDELPDYGGTQSPENARVALWITFANTGPETAEFTVEKADTPLGAALPNPVRLALAPGQRVLLPPFRSASEHNLTSLDLALTVQKSGSDQTRHVLLQAIPEVNFHAADIDGTAFDATDGKTPATVWVFIAHDCPISNEYAPVLHRLAAKFPEQKAHWRIVYAEPGLTHDELRAHAKAYALTSPAFADPDLRLARACGISITPEVAVISAQGRLVYRGRIDDRFGDLAHKRLEPHLHDLETAIAETIDGRPVTRPRTQAAGCVLELPANAAAANVP